MNTAADRNTAAARLRVCALGGLGVMVGVIHFLMTTSGKPDNAMAWTWAITAMGFSVIFSGLLIGGRSRVARTLLVGGIIVLVASIFVVKIAQVLPA